MSALTGKRILIVEDEFLIALTAETFLADLGAVVVGPAYTIREGLALAEGEALDAAILDVNMGGQRSDPIAAVLVERRIPFILATGYGEREGQRGIPVVDKPYTASQLATALQLVIAAHTRNAP